MEEIITPEFIAFDDSEISEYFIQYEDLVKDSLKLATKIKEDEELNPTYIMAVSRRGCIPATIISLRLNLPMGVVSYSSPKGMGNGAPSARWIMDKNRVMMNNDLVCIVDDICQTGYTLEDLLTIFGQKVSVCTATLYCSDKARMEPTWYVKKIKGYIHNNFI